MFILQVPSQHNTNSSISSWQTQFYLSIVTPKYSDYRGSGIKIYYCCLYGIKFQKGEEKKETHLLWKYLNTSFTILLKLENKANII